MCRMNEKFHLLYILNIIAQRDVTPEHNLLRLKPLNSRQEIVTCLTEFIQLVAWFFI
jgi:hypothetical protein